jgi:hypothetical protein
MSSKVGIFQWLRSLMDAWAAFGRSVSRAMTVLENSFPLVGIMR